MQLISKALQEKGLSQEQLPAEFQEEIQELQTMIKTYNEACDEFEELHEPDAETEKELDDMEHQIVTLEKDIADRIKALSTTAPEEKQKDAEPKKSSGFGWVIGGLALVLTLGAVNVWKKNQ
jgi:hypothetical protein